MGGATLTGSFRLGIPLGVIRAGEGGKSGMIDAIIKYAPILVGTMLVYSAVVRPKPGAKWYGRYVIGLMGVVLLYTSIHLLLKSR
jgi:hypothetical protein